MRKINYFIFMVLIVLALVGCDSDDTSENTEEQEIVETSTPEETETPTPTPEATPLPLPEAVTTTEPQKDSSYIIADSDTRLLSAEEVAAMDANTKQMAINEIFARHGRKFNDPNIQAYFDGKSWYKGTTAPENFSESVFNEVEKSNIALLSNASASAASTDSSYNSYDEPDPTTGNSGASVSSSGTYYIAGEYIQYIGDLSQYDLKIEMDNPFQVDNKNEDAEVGYVSINIFTDDSTDGRWGTMHKTDTANVYRIAMDDGLEYMLTYNFDYDNITLTGGDGYYLTGNYGNIVHYPQ